jgi:cellobiose phosphorylase
MKYGYFDDRNREYVITSPRTPVKWTNYIGTLAFGGIVDHTGGALICKGDPALNRIVKYMPQLPASDFKGETMYIRVKEKDGYRVFSPFYVPTLDPYEMYECRVGMGYSRFISVFYGIRTEVTVFVPRGGSCEIRDIRVTNICTGPLTLDVVPVVEFTHPDALKQYTNADWVPQTMQSRAFPSPDGTLVLLQYPFMHRDTQVNYTASNLPVSSFETDRRMFLGNNEYGTFRNPLSLRKEELSSSEALRGDNLHALMHHLGQLAPGESRELVFLLGQVPSLEEARPVIEKYRCRDNVDAAQEELRAWWEGYLQSMQVETPDGALNSMLNIHNPRQCYITKCWSRYLSLYQLGLGARGIGFRDSSQDVLGVLSNVPHEAAALLEMLLQVQKTDGSAMHQFNPLSMVANEGDSRESEEGPHYYGDDHLWSVLAVCEYLKETGDIDILIKRIPYYDRDRSGRPLETGSVLDHLVRAMEFTHRHRGVHGIPLLGFADWNDTVNLKKGAVSFFIANLYGKALMELIELLEHIDMFEVAAQYREYYHEMRKTFAACAWDGQWFRRYIDHDGTYIGSAENSEGKLYLNGQSWPVISGFADRRRARVAMDAVKRHLNTGKGLKLSTPGYRGFDAGKGGVTTYPPGAKENGGLFLHANTWAIIAETILGNGDRAWEYYRQINPAARNDEMDGYESEPYVYPQNILGDEHPQFGLARNSWLSGTATWMYTAGTKHILGVSPQYDGLKIDPCIPASWDGFTAVRRFRGAVYRISVRNPDHVSRGVKKITVDGSEIPRGIVPVAEKESTVEVEVEMGAETITPVAGTVHELCLRQG